MLPFIVDCPPGYQHWRKENYDTKNKKEGFNPVRRLSNERGREKGREANHYHRKQGLRTVIFKPQADSAASVTLLGAAIITFLLTVEYSGNSRFLIPVQESSGATCFLRVVEGYVCNAVRGRKPREFTVGEWTPFHVYVRYSTP